MKGLACARVGLALVNTAVSVLRIHERSGHVVFARNSAIARSRSTNFVVARNRAGVPVARGVESRTGLVACVEVPADSDGSGGGDEAGGDTRAEGKDLVRVRVRARVRVRVGVGVRVRVRVSAEREGPRGVAWLP